VILVVIGIFVVANCKSTAFLRDVTERWSSGNLRASDAIYGAVA